MRTEELIIKAAEAAKGAYAPYSRYYVGAALLTKDGKVFTGCNVENASYGVTNCAERTAIFKAVSEGYKTFEAIAVVGGPAEVICRDSEQENGTEHQAKKEVCFSDYAYPCGVCRQVMQEFCDSDFKIIVAKSEEDYKVYTLAQLLPFGFGGSAE